MCGIFAKGRLLSRRNHSRAYCPNFPKSRLGTLARTEEGHLATRSIVDDCGSYKDKPVYIVHHSYSLLKDLWHRSGISNSLTHYEDLLLSFSSCRSCSSRCRCCCAARRSAAANARSRVLLPKPPPSPPTLSPRSEFLYSSVSC